MNMQELCEQLDTLYAPFITYGVDIDVMTACSILVDAESILAEGIRSGLDVEKAQKTCCDMAFFNSLIIRSCQRPLPLLERVLKHRPALAWQANYEEAGSQDPEAFTVILKSILNNMIPGEALRIASFIGGLDVKKHPYQFVASTCKFLQRCLDYHGIFSNWETVRVVNNLLDNALIAMVKLRRPEMAFVPRVALQYYQAVAKSHKGGVTIEPEPFSIILSSNVSDQFKGLLESVIVNNWINHAPFQKLIISMDLDLPVWFWNRQLSLNSGWAALQISKCAVINHLVWGSDYPKNEVFKHFVLINSKLNTSPDYIDEIKALFASGIAMNEDRIKRFVVDYLDAFEQSGSTSSGISTLYKMGIPDGLLKHTKTGRRFIEYDLDL